MFSHCVPFPAPGPPNTNITLYLAILYICLETHWMWCSVFVTHRKELLNENCRKPILKSYFRNLQLRQIKYITLMDFCTDHWSKVISNFKSYWILKIYNNSKQIGFFFIVQWTQNIHFNSFLVWLFEMSRIQFDSCIKYKQYPPLYWILNSSHLNTVYWTEKVKRLRHNFNCDDWPKYKDWISRHELWRPYYFKPRWISTEIRSQPPIFMNCDDFFTKIDILSVIF